MLLTISDRTSSYVQFMVVLLLFVFVLVLTYITTRWIAGYQKGRVSGGNIEVLEVYKVSANTYIQIVHIGNKYLAIGVGKDQITMLTELSEDELKRNTNGVTGNLSFGSILEKIKNQDKQKDSEIYHKE